MSLKRTLIRMLDHGVGRPLLARLGTLKARQILGEDVEIGFDKGWYHRLGRFYVPDGPRFVYFEPDVLSWKTEVPTYFSDAEDLWFIDYRPKPGDVIVDVGAGRGEDALAFSEAVGPTGKVIAFEAHPATFRHLKRFCELNRLTNVFPIHGALMDRPGVVQIADSENWEASTVKSGGAGVPVQALTLDDFCRKHGIDRVDYIKMNIEGAERAALLGMSETMQTLDNLCICAHDFRADRGESEDYRTRDFVIDVLTRHGYSISRRATDPRDFVRDHIFGTRKRA